VKIWLRCCASFDEKREADAEFWRPVSSEERVRILEEMRGEWLDRNGRVDEGLRRAARLLDNQGPRGNELLVVREL
jgi:hypothetical protein